MMEWLLPLWTDSSIKEPLFTALFTALLYGLRILATSKAKIKWGIAYSHIFLMKNDEGQDFSVKTAEIWISNEGRAAADDLEVSFNWKPRHIEIFPHIPYQSFTREDGRFIVQIGHVSPNTNVTMTLFNVNDNLPEVTNVRWRGGKGKAINLWISRRYNNYIGFIALIAMMWGAGNICLLFLQLIIGRN